MDIHSNGNRIGLVCMTLAVLVAGQADGKEAWWNTFGISSGLTQDLKLNLKAKQKVDQFSEVGSHYVAAIPSYKVNSWMTLGTEYRHVFEQTEDRLALIPTLKTKLGAFSLSDRNKMEYRIKSKNTVRYRNRVKLSRKVSVLNHGFKPYISDEIFYDLTNGEFTTNEFAVGFSTGITKQFGVGLYYLLQHKLSKSAEPSNIVGSALSLAI